MSAWWNALPVLQQFFYLLAIPATVLLVIQTVLLLIGLGHGDSDFDHDGETDLDHDLCADHDADAGGACDADHDFDHSGDGPEVHDTGLRLFSVRGIVAFFAICGWTGVAMLDLGLPPLIACPIALAAGICAMFLVAGVLALLSRLQQSGNLNMHNAVGLSGEVYIPIPEGGKGKITLILQERFTEADAVCPTGALPTGQPVTVVDVAENNILIVKPKLQ